MFREAVEIERHRRLRVAARQRRSADRARRERHPRRTGDPAHAQVEIEVAAQPLDLRCHLVEKRRADETGADQPIDTVCGDR